MAAAKSITYPKTLKNNVSGHAMVVFPQSTPPNSEIICVQNVGAKADMVSYLKKINEN